MLENSREFNVVEITICICRSTLEHFVTLVSSKSISHRHEQVAEIILFNEATLFRIKTPKRVSYHILALLLLIHLTLIDIFFCIPPIVL